MKLTIVNKSHLTDESVNTLLNWLGESFADVGKPVRVTILKRPGRWGVWGRAYWPTKDNRRRAIKPGEYSIRLYVGMLERPGGWNYSRTYKKRAGPANYQNFTEVFVHTAAHELRHVEQFWMCEQANPNWEHKLIELPKNRGLYGGHRKPRFYDIWRQYEKNRFAGSCEVDAEILAHKLLDGFRYVTAQGQKLSA